MPMNNDSIIEQIRKMLADRPEIDFAYVHGSVIDHDAPRDIDLAPSIFMSILIFVQEGRNIWPG